MPTNKRRFKSGRPHAMHIVYIVKKSEDNEELRYSLRSLANLEHESVWIVGYRPSWVRNVEYIKGNEFDNKWDNTSGNLRLMAASEMLPESLVVMSDDIFIMSPADAVLEHRSSIAHFVKGKGKKQRYVRDLDEVDGWFRSRGVEKPLLYDIIHSPFPLEKTKFRLAMDACPHKLSWRSIYGNTYQLESGRAADYKVFSRTANWDGRSFVSTSDSTFSKGRIGRQIRSRFPEPSVYEA